MAVVQCVELSVILTVLWTFTRGDAADVEVSCVFMESCILPCSFQPGPDVVIHWIQETTGNTPVHSYYHNKDQLVAQNLCFRGRTSLFQDQISRGNASLQLTGVKVQDEGRYQCYTSSETAAEKTFIILKVEVSGRSAETGTSSTAVIVGSVLAVFCIYKKIKNVQTEGDGVRDRLDVAQSVPMMPNTANGGVQS